MRSQCRYAEKLGERLDGLELVELGREHGASTDFDRVGRLLEDDAEGFEALRADAERLRAALLASQATSGIPPETAAIAPEAQAVLEVEDVFVQKIRRYVEEHIGNADLSMDELSRAMTMSYQNLHRKLTALTSLAPVQFIRLIRLQKAKALLQTTRRPIGEIAFEVGFNDPKYFSRVFAEEYGSPPSSFRKP